MRKSAAGRAGVALGLLIAALALLRHEVAALSWSSLNAAIREIPARRLWAAGILTALNYAVLTCFDQLAFRHIRRRPSAGHVAVVSFIAYAVSNTVGFALVSGSAVRYRFYSRWGLSAEEIAQLVVFYTSTFWLGLLVVGGAALMLAPPPAVFAMLPVAVTQVLGALLLGIAAAYAVLPFLDVGPVRIGSWQFRVPKGRIVLAQFALSTCDWLLAAAVLWTLLPVPQPSFFAVTASFIGAQLAGLGSHIPAGVGVFESVMVVLMKPAVSGTVLVPVLVMYRAIYYLAPFAVALAVIAIEASYQHRAVFGRVSARLGSAAAAITPVSLAGATFLAGAVLLFSGATPAIASRLAVLSAVMPVALLEISHFLASIVGVALLLLSRALSRRSDGAWALAVVALVVGVVTSLLKGGDYEEAILLAAVLLALLRGRRMFDRRATVFEEPFSPSWFAAVVAVVSASVFLGAFAFAHVEYSSELWWQFALHGDASRFLRASIGVGVAVLAFAVRYLLSPASPAAPPPQPADLVEAAAVARTFPWSYGHLALAGDKALLWNPARSAFLMYSIHGRTWVSLHDPVAPPADVPRLLRAFLDKVDDYDGVPVAYQVRPEHLHHYADLGLTFVKVGEEAIVPLQSFSLDGGERKVLRTAVNRLQREGFVFRLLDPPEVAARLDELRDVSDDWLERKAVAEKGFSVGAFEDDYVRRCPVAVIERDGRIEAFANLWLGSEGQELSVDLARFRRTAPPSAMQGLFAHVMLWGRDRGYSRFNLGMAPLAGIERSRGPSLWRALASYVFEHGENLYNFQGLRANKEKFAPVWEPRYLAYPGGLALARVLPDVAALIAGGYRRIFFKAA